MFIDFKERRSEKEKHLPPIHTPTGDRTHNLGTCPNRELNLRPFGVQDNAPTNGATRPGPSYVTRYNLLCQILIKDFVIDLGASDQQVTSKGIIHLKQKQNQPSSLTTTKTRRERETR